jgi:type II secretion system protein G
MRKNKGFTLIELIVVIGVMVILASSVFAILDPVGQLQKANDGKRKADLSGVQKSLEQYYQDFGRYPASSQNEIVDFKTNTPLPWGSSWQPYMNELPADPTNTRKYIYVVRSDMQAYWIYASLERDTDPSVCNKGGACVSLISNGVANNACGTTCNYGVSSPNVSP